MKKRDRNTPEYKGFEQGPIRPPSEASSLLIRITRNCPWNRCTFCPVYKGSGFSIRPVKYVLKDIDLVHRYATVIRESGDQNDTLNRDQLIARIAQDGDGDNAALSAALHWARSGMRSIFLQDANSLLIKPEQLLEILNYLTDCFPWVERITSYARSHTIARISDENLLLMRKAGLSRIHIGMESGSDKVLGLVKKGVDKQTQIRAGRKVKKAGIELSEYLMPGLGGREFSKEHALESADALNQINPDYIRLRTLAIPHHVELYQDYSSGSFQKTGDVEAARELLVFLEALDGITSTIKSDHILNLFEDLEGTYPQDKERMLYILHTFLELNPTEQMTYVVGRRMGLFRGLEDLRDEQKRHHVKAACTRSGITPENMDDAIDELMKRFI